MKTKMCLGVLVLTLAGCGKMTGANSTREMMFASTAAAASGSPKIQSLAASAAEPQETPSVIVCRYNLQLTNVDPYRSEKNSRIGQNPENDLATVININEKLAAFATELRPDLKLLYYKQHDLAGAQDSRSGFGLATAELRQDSKNVCDSLGYLGLSTGSGLSSSSPAYANVTLVTDICCGQGTPSLGTCGHVEFRCGDL